MSATTVRNALVSQLQADAVLLAEFGLANIKKGIETNFDINTATKGLRVAIEISRQSSSDLISRNIDAIYGFKTVSYFYETDSLKVDDRFTQYDEIVREAIEKDLGLGINARDLSIGQAQCRKHQKINNLYFLIIPVLVMVRELRANR